MSKPSFFNKYVSFLMGILLQILILLWARSADFLGVIWTAQAPPKRQVVGSNPSGPDTYLYLY